MISSHLSHLRPQMKILSWNIQHGGGTRATRIIDAIAAHDPDVIALSEFRTKPGAPLCAALAARGWIHLESTNPTGSDNGLCVLSRTPIICSRPALAPPENAVRWLDVDFPEHSFGIGILHIVCAGPKIDGVRSDGKARFWDAVIAAAESRHREPFMYLGDFNTGAHKIDEIGKTFFCTAQFSALLASGWTDMWRHHHTGPTEWTWYSKFRGGARGNGFRLDHAFATPSLVPRVTSCRYSHDERDAGISDHSMLIVEVE